MSAIHNIEGVVLRSHEGLKGWRSIQLPDYSELRASPLVIETSDDLAFAAGRLYAGGRW